MRWSEIGVNQPALGAILDDLLIRPGVVLIGTTRRDGSARISGAEPLVLDGQLWLSMMPVSAKASDLARDRRILLHSIVTSRAPSGEVMLRGPVSKELNREVQTRYATSVAARLGWRPVVGEFALFSVNIDDVTYIGHTEDNAQHVARWPAGAEYLRALITPTTLGPPQPVQRLLIRKPPAKKTGRI